jgi:TfoX/Sxy family transcriptional regulator of competence genes
MQKLGEVNIYHDGETFKVVISYANGDELILEGEDLEETLEQLATEMSDKYGKIQRG